MSTALKRLIPFLVPFVVFLVAAALGGLAADQPENHQALAEPVTGVGEAGVSPVNEAGESYSSATSGVQEATAPGAVLLDAIDAESDKVDNQAEGGERMKKVEEELSLLRRELYDRTDRPGLKRAVILSLGTSALIAGRMFSSTLRAAVPWYAVAFNAIVAAYYIRKVLTYRRRVMTKRQPFMSSVKNFFSPQAKGWGCWGGQSLQEINLKHSLTQIGHRAAIATQHGPQSIVPVSLGKTPLLNPYTDAF